MKKRILYLFIGLFLLLLSGCGKATEKSVSKSDFYFDTIITITLYDTENDSLIDDCFALADHYENLFSNTIAESDVSRINSNAGSFVSVDEKTISLVQKSIAYCKKSDGKFDITLGRLSDLWNFSEISKNTKSDTNEVDSSVLPSPSRIEKLLSHIDYKNIAIDDTNNQICLQDKEAKLDLGGIAKGFIADEMKQYLVDHDVHSGIINLGGNVLTIGNKQNGDPFSVGIQKPFSSTGEILGLLRIDDQSVVTSGIYERYYRVNNKIYHHILDLSTGYPYENDLYEVTIISDQSADGDALSTICFALGLSEGMKLIEETDGVEAIFVDSNFNLHCSTGVRDKDLLTTTSS